ncbi:hypothetical protein AMJ52_04845 [candidate division TA06 bacterium DG_78]|uniref:DUF4837 domain-containing protein n=1 Tax=candidate division TA06 bacterium DG_78 TaxID=1703772 RepID=A0A0S7YDU2_UNCT6|nr:MAG: hypothetical protein AMJ52_04845 [candidate division TA06 bacterium DG_78]
MKKSIVFVLFLCLLFSCAKIPPNVGKSREVVVVASKINEPLIVNTLQIYNYVPQKEELFSFIFTADTTFKNYNKFHTILLYGSLDDKFISTLLNPEAREATKNDTFTLFKLNNLWAKGQLAIVLAVSELRYIESGIKKYSTLISKILNDNYYDRIKQNYYTEAMDSKINVHLKNFGITFDFQKGWMIDSTYSNENFICIHAHFPDRSIFFYKEKLKGYLTDSIVIDKRNLLTKKYYNGDYVLKELTAAENIEFRAMKGIRLRGVWQNDSLVAGGPFISYFLVNSDSLYVIDGMIFHPGERKSDYLTKIEVIMNSVNIMHP